MHPAFADRGSFAVHFGAWLGAGVVVALVARAALLFPWTGALLFGLPLGLVGGPVALSAWYVLGARRPASGSVRPVIAVVVSALVASVLWAWVAQAWWGALTASGLIATDVARPGGLAVLVSLGVAGYLLAAAAYQVGQSVDATTRAARRALEADVAHRDAELRALRAQLNPHFLFNSLNSIAGLIAADPGRAREMCQRLGEFLRESLQVGQAPRIPLAREMALVEQYLRIEQVRFGARLDVVLHVEADTRDVAVPPLLLQPLVENAVRHGVATRIDGGTVAVTTRRAGDRVIIVVTNPRDADSRRGGTGLGIDIVRRRLAAAYGDMAALAIEAAPESYQASVTVPVQEPS